MKKLLSLIKAEEVIEICFEGNNWMEIMEFVGMENFHLSLGTLFIKTRNGNLTQVNPGDSVVRLASGRFEVFTKSEIAAFEIIESDYEEPEELKPEPEEVEEEDESKIEIEDQLN